MSSFFSSIGSFLAKAAISALKVAAATFINAVGKWAGKKASQFFGFA